MNPICRIIKSYPLAEIYLIILAGFVTSIYFVSEYWLNRDYWYLITASVCILFLSAILPLASHNHPKGHVIVILAILQSLILSLNSSDHFIKWFVILYEILLYLYYVREFHINLSRK